MSSFARRSAPSFLTILGLLVAAPALAQPRPDSGILGPDVLPPPIDAGEPPEAGPAFDTGVQPGVDPHEPNDTCAQAAPVMLPFTTGDALIDRSTDRDCYGFDARSGDRFNGNAFLFNGGILDLAVSDASGTVIADGPFGNVDVTLPADGRYCLAVTCSTRTSTSPLPGPDAGIGPQQCSGQYRLSMSSFSLGPDRFEPNGTTATATPISPPTFEPGLTIHSASDVDVFAVSALAGDVLAISARPQMLFFFPHIALIDASGATIQESFDSFLGAAIPADGTYFVSISAASPGEAGDYVLSVDRVRLGPDPYEPNDSRAAATPIPPSFFLADGTIFPAGDVDHFQLDLSAGDIVFANVQPRTFTFNMQVELQDASGNVLAASPFGVRAPIPANGSYYVVVSGGGSVGDYVLSVEVQGLPFDAFEPNDTPATATRIDPQPDFNFQANLRVGDLDFFAIDEVAGTTLFVQAFPTFGNLSPLIVVLDPSGVVIAGGLFSTPQIELPAAGRYVIGITSSDDFDLTGARAADGYFSVIHVERPPRVNEPGHAFSFIAQGLLGAGIATDASNGDVYVLGQTTSWFLSRIAGDQIVFQSFLSPPPTVGYYPYISTDFEVRRGFGGSDLFSADDRGQVVGMRAPNGDPMRLFAPALGAIETGLAFARGSLFVSGGLGASSISMVSSAGAISPFMGPAELGSTPTTLAASPDGQRLYYSSPTGEVVTIDIANRREIARVAVAPPGFTGANMSVEPSSGDVFAMAIADGMRVGPGTIVRYNPATGALSSFAENIPGASDLAFGSCAGPTSNEWCLYVTTARGVMKIGGFPRPFDIPDRAGDAARADIVGADVTYVDQTGSGSSTHMVVRVQLASAVPAQGSVHALIDFGESAALGADIDLEARFNRGRVQWNGLPGLDAGSSVSGNVVRFVAPIDRLRQKANDKQREAATESVRVWVTSLDEGVRPSVGDRAPNTGAYLARSFFPNIVVNPASIDFAGVPIGGRAVRGLSISNLGVGAAEMKDVQVQGRGFALQGGSPAFIGEGETAVVQISCAPTSVGALTGEAKVRSKAPNTTRSVPLACRGFRLPGQLSFADARGDAIGRFSGDPNVPDLREVTYQVTLTEVIVRQRFDRPVAFNDFARPPPGPEVTVIAGAIELDTDRNTASGSCFGCQFGAQYAIGSDLFVSYFQVFDGRIDLGNGAFVTATATGNVAELRFASSLVAGGACLDFAIATGTPFEPADFNPDTLGGANSITAGCAQPTTPRRGHGLVNDHASPRATAAHAAASPAWGLRRSY